MEDNNARTFVLTEDNQIAIKVPKPPYAILEINTVEEFRHIQMLLAKDTPIPVHLVRETVRNNEFCTAICPRCKVDLFIKKWSEKDSWVLPKYCSECGQELNWISMHKEDWMPL